MAESAVVTPTASVALTSSRMPKPTPAWPTS
jgi:hypothetical protein